jgi:hypothetical protein
LEQACVIDACLSHALHGELLRDTSSEEQSLQNYLKAAEVV